ncbi:MAG: YbjN domain-containing protein [Rhodobacteraceae bacterium]|jgi:hypothetical protein|nr:YbjN domain-containing protein [Paracoccaceae bacterium]
MTPTNLAFRSPLALAGGLALALAAGGAASAQTPPPLAAAPEAGQQSARLGLLVDAADPPRIAEMIRTLGFAAEFDGSEPSSPFIRGSAEGANYGIQFYGCTNGTNCRAIQFVAGFTLNTPPTLEVANNWNKRRIVGQAYIADSGAIRIAYYVAMQHGVSETNFGFLFEQWRIALRDFMDHIGFR